METMLWILMVAMMTLSAGLVIAAAPGAASDLREALVKVGKAVAFRRDGPRH